MSQNLGNFGGAIPLHAQGIQVVQDNGNWYVFIVGGQREESAMIRLDFGNSLSNFPAVANLGNPGNCLDYPEDLYITNESGNWIGGHDELHVTHTPQRHLALAVLGGLRGVGGLELPLRARDLAERLGNQREGGVGLELPSDEQHGVVGLVVVPVEGLQPLDGHVLDVGAGADGRVAVVVPEIRRAQHALEQHARGAVLADLELVAHHAHLAVEIALRDARRHHPVGFHAERPLEGLLRSRERLVVVRAIVVGAAVHVGEALGHLVRELRVLASSP